MQLMLCITAISMSYFLQSELALAAIERVAGLAGKNDKIAALKDAMADPPMPPETGPGMILLFVVAVLVQAVWHASTWPRFWFETAEEKK